MTSISLLSWLIFYLFVLWAISKWASNKTNENGYFLSNRTAPWLVVAIGMIGDSLSGVTFISVPGWVGKTQFSYYQMVLGYIIGYAAIAFVLLPLYYRENLTSIYSYLGKQLGIWGQRSGALSFIVSRLIGAAFRLYLAVLVLSEFTLGNSEYAFYGVALLVVIAILIYTLKGGMKSLVWTDLLQSSVLMLSLIFSLIFLKNELGWSFSEMIQQISTSKYSQVFFWDPLQEQYFWKQFISGAFIALVMTGLDQNMMQKNLSIRTLKEAQKNIMLFTCLLLVVNLIFLSLGALLYQYAEMKQMTLPERSDELFPLIALHGPSQWLAGTFLLGLVAAAFSSADSVLTTLTTTTWIDLLGKSENVENTDKNLRRVIHASYGGLLLLIIVFFYSLRGSTVISAIFTAAGYTYGPLLGMFFYARYFKQKVGGVWILGASILSPLISYASKVGLESCFPLYKVGYELLVFNALCMLGLLNLGKLFHSNQH